MPAHVVLKFIFSSLKHWPYFGDALSSSDDLLESRCDYQESDMYFFNDRIILNELYELFRKKALLYTKIVNH